jgi:acyl carrier protein
MTTTLEKLSTILIDQYQIEAQLIEPTSTLVSLGLDSLTMMEFVFSAEDAFELRIPEDRLGDSLSEITLQGICDAIDQLKKGESL